MVGFDSIHHLYITYITPVDSIPTKISIKTFLSQLYASFRPYFLLVTFDKVDIWVCIRIFYKICLESLWAEFVNSPYLSEAVSKKMKVISTDARALLPARSAQAELLNSSLVNYSSLTLCARLQTGPSFSEIAISQCSPQLCWQAPTNLKLKPVKPVSHWAI